MRSYRRAQPLAIRPRRMWAHMADVRVGRGHFVAYCHGLFGDASCDFGGRYPTHEAAREAVDGHMIYTHVTGGHLCGNGKCTGCAAIRRQSLGGDGQCTALTAAGTRCTRRAMASDCPFCRGHAPSIWVGDRGLLAVALR